MAGWTAEGLIGAFAVQAIKAVKEVADGF